MSGDSNLFYQQLQDQGGPDYVEVVRCKDCRHYTRKHGKLPWNTDKRYCNRSATVATAPDDFCSFGEKRAL